MKQLTIGEIPEITGGRWISGQNNCPITGISTDSRLIRPGEFFIAVHGRQFDGNDYAAEAIGRGASGVLVNRLSKGLEELEPPGNVILVEETITAMQSLAAHWRRGLTCTTIGVTGSTGKTIVKDMLFSILSNQFPVHCTPLSFHGQIGLPLTIFSIPPTSEIAVLELGISQRGEMAKLAAIANCDIAIVTNISETHLEHLGTIETVAEEKAKIFSSFTTDRHSAVINADDPRCVAIAGDLHCSIVTFGIREAAQYNATSIIPVGRKGAWCTIVGPEGEWRLFVNAPGRHNIYNALAAIAAARTVNASFESIRQGLETFHLPQMRLEIHTNSILEENVTIINDTYNASPASMRGALDSLKEMAGPHRTIAVLGDMRELGNFSYTAHDMIGGEVYQHGIDLLLTIGSLAKVIGQRAIALGMKPERVIHCDDSVDAAERLGKLIHEDDFILFKGSRLLQLDLLAAQFIGGIRPTKLVIDLEAIAHNIRQIRNRVGPDISMMAVVKSGGYGHDSRKIARVVLENGADYLAVAVPDEGIFLRKAGFSETPILVMGPTLPEEAAKLVKYRLAQVVFSRRLAIALNREAAGRGVRLPIHLKVDTGMGRIGLLPAELPEFLDLLQGLPNLDVEGVMTHLSSADDAAADDFTRSQLVLFCEMIMLIEKRGFTVPYRHAAASAAIMRLPESWFTMVRPGIMMYGLNPSPKMDRNLMQLSPAARFMTKIAHIKTVPASSPISYSRSFVTLRETRVATLPVGYYDGYNRLLSNRAHVIVRGKRAPILGNITMDMTMIDVTHIPDAVIGDEVILFGNQNGQEIKLEELASLCGTIHYELIGNISARVCRVYEDA